MTWRYNFKKQYKTQIIGEKSQVKWFYGDRSLKIAVHDLVELGTCYHTV